MTTGHMIGTQEQWQTKRDELLAEEKELTRRGDELASKRRELPWVRVEKEYRFETERGTEALIDLFDDETLSADFDLEPGQLQFVDNRVLGHARTEFADFPEPERRRHLVRLWLRDRGRRAYAG